MRKRFFFLPVIIISVALAASLQLAGCGLLLDLIFAVDDERTEPVRMRAERLYGFEGDDTSLLVVQGKDGLFGYIDRNGNIAIEPAYEGAMPFSEGLAAVYDGFYWGYIDRCGNLIIDFQYDYVGQFRRGHAAVALRPHEDGKIHREMRPAEARPHIYPWYALIDASGKEIFPLAPGEITVLADGTVYRGQEGTYFYTPDLKNKSEYGMLTYEFSFSEGLAPVRNASNPLGYIDETGKLVIEPKFCEASDFHEGLAAVVPWEYEYWGHAREGALWGYVDRTGEFAIEPRFESARAFGEGLAAVYTGQNGWFFIDKSGDKVFEPSVSIVEAGSFSEGLCAVRGEAPSAPINGGEDHPYLWGFIDRTGRLVIDFKYGEVSPFIDGIAQVIVDGKIGYIDKTGKYIWEPR